MTKLRLIALFFIAASAYSAWATGSNVYKCGSSYSQTPCEGAVPVHVDDARSTAQKLQSDAATLHQGKTANAMEKTRLKEEAQALAQNKVPKPKVKPAQPAQTKAETDTSAQGASQHGKRKKKEPEFFTAKETPPAKKK